MIRKDIYKDNTVKQDIKESRTKLAVEPDEFEVIELPGCVWFIKFNEA
jgi:hypothetical protein